MGSCALHKGLRGVRGQGHDDGGDDGRRQRAPYEIVIYLVQEERKHKEEVQTQRSL